MQKKRTSKFWLVVALIICLISSVGASIVQSGGGKIRISTINFSTPSGHELSAILCIPETATAENPAPAIVCSHGWYNNKQMQDLNYIEYARRGFVVMSIDMYGHGDSDNLADGTWWNPENNANGMYDAVKYLTTLNYVDTDRIGVTGHSNGGQASREAIFLDNEAEEQLISAILIVSNDPIFTVENTMQGGTGARRIYDTSNDTYYNMFGSRDAGVVACKYDEFMHGAALEDGTYSSPRDYIHQKTAQSFLYFGTDPEGKEERSSYTLYTENIDGEDAIRVIYDPSIIHPWAHFSAGVVASSLEFFDAAFDAPIKIDYNNQIWQWKAAFNALGIVGMFLFAVALTGVLLQTGPFKELAAKGGKKEPSAGPEGKGKAWYWGCLGAGVLFSILVYPSIYRWCNAVRPAFFNQPATFYVGMWTILCGLFMILTTVVSYKAWGRSHGVDLKENGTAITAAKLGKTIILAAVVIVSTYGLVFVSQYLFGTDYRLWVLTFRTFKVDKFPVICKFLPFYLVYYIALSVSANSFNYVRQEKHAWMNLFVQCAAVAAGLGARLEAFGP